MCPSSWKYVYVFESNNALPGVIPMGLPCLRHLAPSLRDLARFLKLGAKMTQTRESRHVFACCIVRAGKELHPKSRNQVYHL